MTLPPRDEPPKATLDQAVPAPVTPMVIDVKDAKVTAPAPAPVTRLPPLAQAGVDLTHRVLTIVGYFLAGSILLLFVGEWYSASAANDRLQILIRACHQAPAAPSAPRNPPRDSGQHQRGSGTPATRARQDSVRSVAAADSAHLSAAVDTTTHPAAFTVTATPTDAGCSLTSEGIRATLAATDTEQAAFRSFGLEVFKTVLLNVLLPVLTALLGYVFGSRSEH